jgi:hypothetical protein
VPARLPGRCATRLQRLAIVDGRHGLTCDEAAREANRVATRYEHGLPRADYPPPPYGVPGGKHRTFRVAGFSCLMTARGSDFVEGAWSQGYKHLDFTDDIHRFLRSHSVSRRPSTDGVDLLTSS